MCIHGHFHANLFHMSSDHQETENTQTQPLSNAQLDTLVSLIVEQLLNDKG